MLGSVPSPHCTFLPDQLSPKMPVQTRRSRPIDTSTIPDPELLGGAAAQTDVEPHGDGPSSPAAITHERLRSEFERLCGVHVDWDEGAPSHGAGGTLLAKGIVRGHELPRVGVQLELRKALGCLAWVTTQSYSTQDHGPECIVSVEAAVDKPFQRLGAMTIRFATKAALVLLVTLLAVALVRYSGGPRLV